MKNTVETYTIKSLFCDRQTINIPIYQRAYRKYSDLALYDRARMVYCYYE
ncbi:MAG: hypothetical protein Ta2G_17180 [Termitinemataceae bacterium]|nr:MAG: hypothetical protein Ta2G_17180 [Termitinemataceae bacterium]